MTASSYCRVGATHPLLVYVLDRAGAPLTGITTFRVSIFRVTDGFTWDFNDSSFKSSGWTTPLATLTQVNATAQPGWYYLAAGFPTTGFTSETWYGITFTDTLGTSTASSMMPSTEFLGVGVVASPGDLMGLVANAITSAKLATGAITSGAFAAGAIDAAAIATDAIGSAELAASAVTKIQSAILSDATPFQGARIDAAITSRTAPGALMGLADDAITAAKIAADAGTEIGTAVWATSTRSLSNGAIVAATFGSGAIDAAALATDAGTELATAVWSTTVPGAFASGTAGYNLDARVSAVGGGSAPSAATIAAAVWDELESGHAVANSFGIRVKTNLDITVSSRSAPGAAMTLASGALNAAAVASGALDAVWATATRTLTGAGSSGLATATGVSAIPGLTWDVDLVSGHGTADTSGLMLRALGAGILGRANEPHTLAGLLGVLDQPEITLVDTIANRTIQCVLADETITPSAFAPGAITWQAFDVDALRSVWDVDVVAGHGTGDTSGRLLRALGAGIAGRSNTPTLAGLLAVSDTAGQTLALAIDTRLSAQHGPGSWATATGFAVAGDAMSLLDGAITASKIAASAFTAVKFGSGAIDSTVFAQTAADRVWSSSTRTLTSATNLGSLASQASLDAVAAALALAMGASFTSGDDLHSIKAAAAAAAAPSAATVAAAVWATADGGASGGTAGTMLHTVTLIRKWTTYATSTPNAKRVVGQNLLVINDDGTTLSSTPLADISGGAIAPAAGEPARLG